MNNIVTEMINTLEGINSRIFGVENTWINDLEDIMAETGAFMEQNEEKDEKN